MTKKESFESLKNIVAESSILTEDGRNEMLAFIDHEIELINKSRNAVSLKQKAKRKENEGIKREIMEALAGIDHPATVSELVTQDSLSQYSPQHVTALLHQMIEVGAVVRTMEKRKAFFSIAG